jgi:hypothetical protein
MLNFTDATFRYEPYPIGVARMVFDQAHYDKLIRAWPPESSFKQLTGAYNKWSLSERNRPEHYIGFIKTSPIWLEFYRYVKQGALLSHLFSCLARAGIEVPQGKFSTRFEFSSLPADGGGIEAHTDIPSKVFTLILPIMRAGEWDETWGGGTEVLRPVDPWRRYQDYREPRKAFETAETYAYAPNQCVIFIKTFNSWHAVGPIQGPVGQWRRTLTLNVEKVA